MNPALEASCLPTDRITKLEIKMKEALARIAELEAKLKEKTREK